MHKCAVRKVRSNLDQNRNLLSLLSINNKKRNQLDTCPRKGTEAVIVQSRPYISLSAPVERRWWRFPFLNLAH